MSIIYSFISCYLLTTAWVLLWLYSTSRRKILLILSGLRALKRKLKGKEELGEMMPWSCGTVNSSPNSSTPCNLQDTGRAVLLYIIMLRLSLLGRIKKVGWRERNPKLSTVAYFIIEAPFFWENSSWFFFFKFTFESVNWAIVIRVPWITAVYVGTCAAKSCQSANACFPTPTLAERPSTKAQWPQAQDCLWSGKSSRPSFVLLLLGTTKASTPCRVEKYLNVSRESRVKLSDSISAILPVSGSVWGSWLGGPTDMWWPAYHAWNWIGPQPPDMSYCESPASLSSRGTCFPCI